MNRRLRKVVSREEMLTIEKKAIEQYDFSEDLIIENVGIESAAVLLARFNLEVKKSVTVLLGKGNNAADGLALSRHLALAGVVVHVLCFFQEKDFSPALLKQQRMLRLFGEVFFHSLDAKDFSKLNIEPSSLLIIDALFGTGLTTTLGEVWRKIFDEIGQCNLPIVSLDLPSGICSNSLVPSGYAIKADMTLAIGMPKLGPFYQASPHVMGELVVLNAGFHPDLTYASSDSRLIEATFLEPIKDWNTRHKYEKGHAVVIGGGPGMSGALVLSALALQKSGVGLMTLVHTHNSLPEISARAPLDMLLFTYEKGLEEKLEILFSKASCLVIGPGLGRESQALALFFSAMEKLMLMKSKLQVVIDADGLYALGEFLMQGFKLPPQHVFVLTPHRGEYESLLQKILPDQWAERMARPDLRLCKMAGTLGAYIVLKNGPSTMLAEPHGTVLYHHVPCSSLGKAGTGDVLAGILAGCLNIAQLQNKQHDKEMVLTALMSGITIHAKAGVLTPPESASTISILPHVKYFD